MYGGGYGGSGNDTITADGESWVRGESGNDSLIGNASSNVLEGGTGNDTLTCDGYEDQIFFNAPTEGIDTITNFLSGSDIILVSANGFGGALIDNTTIISAQFVYGASALDANDRFIYNTANGALFFDPDGTGTSGKIQLATFSDKPLISWSDISTDYPSA